MNDNLFLIEDHDEALNIWRKAKPKRLPLVHIDAHMDFFPYRAEPLQKVFSQAVSLGELKKKLEHSLAFAHFQKDFSRQTNIGNYIYPAVQEGLVGDFYWVVPGSIENFKKEKRSLKSALRTISGKRSLGPVLNAGGLSKGIISLNQGARKFTVCALESLPVLRQAALLDIDTDFLVTESLTVAGNTAQIGKRKPWIQPADLAGVLKKKVRDPRIITIAYSVNGGFTPLKYKYLGDELAYQLAPGELRERFENSLRVSRYFSLFCSTPKSIYYQKAVRLDPTYRVADNNYGPLYLSLRKFSSAGKEFLKILKADPKNPACLAGLGAIALAKNDFSKARQHYFLALDYVKNGRASLFGKAQPQILFGLAKAEFHLGHLKQAEERLALLLKREPLFANGYYLLGRIFEKEKRFSRAALCYKDALRLRLGIEPLSRLLRISSYLEKKDDIIQYVIARHKEFKNRFIKARRASVNKGKTIPGINNVARQIAMLENKIGQNEKSALPEFAAEDS